MKIPDELFPNQLIAISQDPVSQPDQSKDSRNAWAKLGNCAPIDNIFNYLRNTASWTVGRVFDFLVAVAKAAIASTIAFADTVLWVAVVFSMAAPMILSGLYEASVDRQVLETIRKDLPLVERTDDGNNTSSTSNNAIEPKKTSATTSKAGVMDGEKVQDEIVVEAHPSTTESPNTPPQDEKPQSPTGFNIKTKQRLHLLYAILVGNLELREELDLSAHKLEEQETSDFPADTVRALNAWSDVKWLAREHKDEIEATRMRLKAMLGSQASFGASVGAPVVFFLGSFLFSVFGNLQALGDNDTSLSVAFGEWWMTIPHVAIVSGCLLAGNNPNTLEGIICNLRSMPEPQKPRRFWKTVWDIFIGPTPTTPPQPHREDAIKSSLKNVSKVFSREYAIRIFTLENAINILNSIYGRFYESQYQPVWMWNRGQNKQRWVNKVQHLYYKDPEKLKHPTLAGKLPVLDLIAWFYLVFFAIFLILGPFVLAYLTSYYTPTVGLSCRSFTFVLYFICQGWLSITWGWKFRNTYRRMEGEADEQTAGHLDVVLFISTGLGFCGAMLTTIAGTFMQIAGVYRNCKCMVPMNAWGSSSSPVVLSTNTALQIELAQKYWLKTSIASIVWLIVTCYVGWWYQRHWRSYFKELVDEVLGAEVDAESKKAGEASPAQNGADVHPFPKLQPNVETKEVTQ